MHARLLQDTHCRSEEKNPPWKSYQGKEVDTCQTGSACFQGLFIGLGRNSASYFTSGSFLVSKYLMGLIYRFLEKHMYHNQYRLKNCEKNSMKSDSSMVINSLPLAIKVTLFYASISISISIYVSVCTELFRTNNFSPNHC